MSTVRKKQRKSHHGSARKETIVHAAVGAFSAHGYDATSTREIAKRAGIEQGLLTYHFPNKQALWFAATDHIFDQLNIHIEGVLTKLQELTVKERARHGIREVVRYLAAHPELFRFLVDAGNRSDEMMHWLVDTHLKPRFDFMINEGVVNIRGLNPTIAGHAFFALAGATSLIFAVAPTCERLTGIDATQQAAIDNHAEFIADLMVP
jgi:AcrR family transcriptional regulator